MVKALRNSDSRVRSRAVGARPTSRVFRRYSIQEETAIQRATETSRDQRRADQAGDDLAAQLAGQPVEEGQHLPGLADGDEHADQHQHAHHLQDVGHEGVEPAPPAAAACA